MTVSRSAVEQYLCEVKDAIGHDRYTIARNPKRQDNINLFIDYIIDEAYAKAILLSLEADDFSEVRQNTHPGQEHELLWIFGKDVSLIERFGGAEKIVGIYIKINKLENKYVIVVSFHEQKYPLTYYFR
ncbi:MAG: hypothetical protein K6G34_13130 [Lachnospiraceae bacterium]|nr:hypothetical protein [Lachnospiraceae bacterium]